MRFWGFVLALAMACSLSAASEKLTDDQKIDLIRGLMAEYATAKVELPRSKKPLKFDSAGTYDKSAWSDAFSQYGPAARVGDLVQVTKIDIDSDKIVFQVNGGFGGGMKWYQRIQVGMGTSTVPVMQGNSNAPGGTSIALLFHKAVPPLSPLQIKQLMKPVLDFDRKSVTQNYVASLPPAQQQAVKEKRVIEGMDRDTVLMVLGRPLRKIRETHDGVETEDWVYGTPPGKIVFVTFKGDKVIKVKEDYAGLGTQAPRLPTPE